MVPDTNDKEQMTGAAAGAAEPMTEEDRQLLEKYSKTFIGSFSHSLDAKGRMVVPLAFRETLGETFCIAPSFDFKSIALYPTLQWARMRERYARLGRVNTSLKRYLEQMDALSFRGQECDGQGRVLLPSKIRQCILGEEKDVEITGADDHVRIVARPAADEQFELFMADLPGILNDISALESME